MRRSRNRLLTHFANAGEQHYVLAASGQMSERIVLDNDRVEFWLIERHAAALKAERPDFPGKNVESLISLGDRLAGYCELSPSLRAAAAQEIGREAVRLQSVFARKRAFNHAMERTA